LRLFPSLAIIPNVGEDSVNSQNQTPIAWGFLGADGSLTSLHIEQAYRGKGLARLLTKKLFKEGGYEAARLDGVGAEEDTERGEANQERDMAQRWCHADVALDNKSSRGLCRGLGGEEGWVVYWLRIKIGIFGCLSS
jgi:poly-gamma-glutamate capsule biosynthesis protein CapA/YwtB (metallophosphatase superfamily)